jgi:hypothetical protein
MSKWATGNVMKGTGAGTQGEDEYFQSLSQYCMITLCNLLYNPPGDNN